MKKSGQEIFRPYARLINILGDQLISNKWVGVIELVKNCYDADAENVSVRFFNSDIRNGVIEIEDDGDGMTLEIIQNVWMKPATPNKLQKKKSEKRLTKRGRAMQGDKGVGRFAIYKLGSKIDIYTKTSNENEVVLKLDFKLYTQDDEFSDENSEVNEKFLDQIQNEWYINDEPEKILNTKRQGTLIRIYNLRNTWQEDDLDKLQKAFYKMTPPILPGLRDKIDKDFEVKLFWNKNEYRSRNHITFEKITDLATSYFEASVEDNGKLTYIYKYDGKKDDIGEINLFEDSKYDVSKLKLFKQQFYKENIIIDSKGKQRKELFKYRNPKVGEFYFFVYYFSLTEKAKFGKDEIEYIKENSVYLYRDNTRVYPYGESGDDWLKLSQFRSEDRAGNYFSYNDLIGFVFITQRENSNLRDSADREGLMNLDSTYDDFVALIQAALKVMKDLVTIDKKKIDLSRQKPFITFQNIFEQAFNDFQKVAIESENVEVLDKSKKLFDSANNLIKHYKENLSISQELAGLGMAVEKSTHDMGVMLRQLRENADYFNRKLDNNSLDKNELKQFLKDLRENIELLYQEIQVLTPLMRVSRRINRDISVKEVTERVVRYFRRELEQRSINVNLIVKKDIVVKTNTGLILQVLINLMDNSIYWLGNAKKNQISIKIDGENNQLIFADDGIGIEEEIREIVFLEFFSRKTEGRGLGLYIAKELLDRIDAEISVIAQDRFKILSGANFLIQFNNL
ncbi:ATP-binding protein [Emticicia agri]|uniref:histidine kinase n=1 Tax=Emticicia agri TaxID=2492393 RepID=A0A4Q5LWR7_9BACT|nr:sensor histidine kinase [Emticicia agri]RYU94188.1 sensor histidine kinase [Emticicia agri]